MNLVRFKQKNYDPFQELFQLSNDLLALSPFKGDQTLESVRGNWFPAIDISEDQNHISVKADLPGLRKEDIQVSLDNNILTIRGERKTEQDKKEKNYHRVERSYGVFERSFNLGSSVDGAKVNAVYNDGVLEITIPKSEAAKPKQIEVK